MAYAAYAGTVRLFGDLPDRVPRGEDYLAYRRRFVDALVPGDGRGRGETPRRRRAKLHEEQPGYLGATSTREKVGSSSRRRAQSSRLKQSQRSPRSRSRFIFGQ